MNDDECREVYLSANNLEAEELDFYFPIFPYEIKDFEEGMKYLGFHLKLKCYKKEGLKLTAFQDRKVSQALELSYGYHAKGDWL
jgi:hypothetical protein